jgi:hypothetical protein
MRSNVSKKESNDEQDLGGKNKPITPKMLEQKSGNHKTIHR